MGSSAIVREKLENEIEALDAKIKRAKTERQKIDINEEDIKCFVAQAKNIMEHPAQILLDPINPRIQERLFGLVFAKMPTYNELVFGTPELAWIFKLSSEFTPNKNDLVTLRGFEPRFTP